MEYIGRIYCRCCGRWVNVMYDNYTGEAIESERGDIVLLAGNTEEARRMLEVIIGKENPVSTDS